MKTTITITMLKIAMIPAATTARSLYQGLGPPPRQNPSGHNTDSRPTRRDWAGALNGNNLYATRDRSILGRAPSASTPTTRRPGCLNVCLR